MEIDEHIHQLQELYDLFKDYIDSEQDSEDEYSKLISFLHELKFEDDKDKMYRLLYLTNSFVSNYHRDSYFLSKIERILKHYSDQIKQSVSNARIFQIFKKSKIFLLLLIENEIIEFDDIITDELFNPNDIQDPYFSHFFYPEIKKFHKYDTQIKKIEEELLNYDSNIFENFNEKRHLGENESYISTLIRQDLLDEFITYIHETNSTLTSQIQPSVFETNHFLIKRRTSTLIEYSAFFGSIQIFKYLMLNDVKLTSSIWFYSIHSNNAELINLLEDNHIKFPNDSNELCLKESIKCHHNDIANYFDENMNNDNDEFWDFYGINSEIIYDQTIDCYAYHFCNYKFLSDNYDQKNLLLYAIKYNYLNLVKLLLKYTDVSLNYTVISK